MYDVAEDGKTTTQLRAHVRRLAKELDDMKSIVSLLAMAPDRAQAANWASELEKNGFAHHSVEEIKKSLQVSLIWYPLRAPLTTVRIRQHHHLLFEIKIHLILQVVSSFLVLDMTWDLHRTRGPRAEKGKVKAVIKICA